MSNADPSATTSNAGSPNSTHNNACICCDSPETSDNCVQCDQCKGWWHMKCADVTESVADRSFTCGHCLPLSVCSRTTTSSVSAARLALKRKQLEEQQAMEQRHLAEKYKLLAEELNVIEETGSSRTRVSGRTSQERVKQWQQKCVEQSLVTTTLVPTTGDPQPRKDVTSNKKTSGESRQQRPSGGHQDLSFHQPAVNSTAKPLSLPNERTVEWDQQCYIGATSKTAPIQQERTSQRGMVEPPVPPVAHQGKPLCDPIIRLPIQSNSDNSLQQIINQFGSLAPSATNSILQANRLPFGANSIPLSGMTFGFQPPVNATVDVGPVPPAPGLPNVGQLPHGNPTLSIGKVPPSLEHPNVGYLPRDNPVLPLGQVPPSLGLPIFGHSNQANPNQSTTAVLPSVGLPNVDQFTPSPSQLAARQVMSRDLPTFSGDPADWPIFISSFMNSTLSCGYNSAENLARLQRCLKGPAYESVKSRLLLPESVPQVIDTLRLLYGRPELLISALLQKVRSVAAPKPEKLDTIIDFGMAVRSLCDHLEAAGQQEHLSNPTLLMELVEKLPTHTKMQWADYMLRYPVVNLKTFGEFMLGVVVAISKVTMYTGGNSGVLQKPKQRGAVNSHASEEEPVRESPGGKERMCLCCKKAGHRVAECAVFKTYTVDDRWKFALNNGLCRSCLNAHGRRSCRNSVQCMIEGCQYRHHPITAF